MSLIFAALLAISWFGITLSTGSTIRLNEPAESARTLTVDEATYYEYVAPRLERLVAETDSVLELVKTRSRNVISLSVHGNRIDTLAAEIRAFGAEKTVPERFAAIHQQILDGSDEATSAIAAARSALRRFDFSGLPALIPQFESGSMQFHQAWRALSVVAAATPMP